MYIHTIQFKNSAEHGWAFHHLAASAYVDACLANPEKLEIRFVASAEQASLLIERIYLRGALTWCLRSTLRSAELDRAGRDAAASA